jgi:hypothetical protein
MTHQTPTKSTRNRSLTKPRVTITLPPEPITELKTGDRISSRAGIAIITDIEQVGRAQVIHADYGSGISHPHRVEDVLGVVDRVQATLNLLGQPCQVEGVVLATVGHPLSTATMQYRHEIGGGVLEGEVQVPRSKLSPLEQNEQEDTIAMLENQTRLIQAAGAIAPDSCWLEQGKCSKRINSRQVFYRSSQPIFQGNKRRYVGMVGSSEAADAGMAIARRNELKVLRKQLEILKGGDP